MATPTSPFMDHAAPILQGDPALSDEQRADLWDAFQTKSPEELVDHLQPLAIPEDTKHQLWTAKKMAVTPTEPLDKTAAAIQRMTQLDPKTLELAESHPNVLKVLVAAASTPEKGSESPSGASKAAPKGNTPAKGEKPAPPAPDVPATPSGHALVQASDGGMYHIPHDNIDKAKSLDPRLTVLHVEP